jgi:hypothetical protein
MGLILNPEKAFKVLTRLTRITRLVGRFLRLVALLAKKTNLRITRTMK